MTDREPQAREGAAWTPPAELVAEGPLIYDKAFQAVEVAEFLAVDDEREDAEELLAAEVVRRYNALAGLDPGALGQARTALEYADADLGVARRAQSADFTFMAEAVERAHAHLRDALAALTPAPQAAPEEAT